MSAKAKGKKRGRKDHIFGLFSQAGAPFCPSLFPKPLWLADIKAVNLFICALCLGTLTVRCKAPLTACRDRGKKRGSTEKKRGRCCCLCSLSASSQAWRSEWMLLGLFLRALVFMLRAPSWSDWACCKFFLSVRCRSTVTCARSWTQGRTVKPWWATRPSTRCASGCPASSSSSASSPSESTTARVGGRLSIMGEEASFFWLHFQRPKLQCSFLQGETNRHLQGEHSAVPSDKFHFWAQRNNIWFSTQGQKFGGLIWWIFFILITFSLVYFYF